MLDSTNYPPLTQCFLEAMDKSIAERPGAAAQMYRASPGNWQSYSAAEVLRRTAGLAKALAALSVKSGDRVGIFAPNCPEWHIADFAALGLGAVDVPIYFNESPERLTYIWNDAGVKVALVAGEVQVKKVAAVQDKIPSLEEVIVVSAPENLRDEFLDYAALIGNANDDDVADYRREAAQIEPQQLASLIYTSGTTGEPKGVMLTHANISSNCVDAIAGVDYEASDLQLSFLPLSHIYERMFDYVGIFNGIPIAYLDKIEDAAAALLGVRPTIAAAVPRVFEKMYANIIEKGHREKGIRRRIFDWALRVALEAVPWKAYGRAPSSALRRKWNVANRLVYSKIRAGVGGRMRIFYSGGAPLAKELAEFYWAVGIAIYQGYGLTETSPVIASNTPAANKVGTVGRPIRNCEVQIAADGEILARGPNIMQGYYNKPDATRDALAADGWLRTGDIGHLDEDDYLVITDRKKELIKTAAGKFVAPAPIEIQLRTSPFISNAMVVGDARKFVSALIVPNRAAILAKARSEGVTLRDADICASVWVRNLISAELERLTENLAQYEKPKRFALIESDFSVEGGELTHALKLKRRVVLEKYGDVIAQLYADVEEPRPQARA